MQKEETSPKDTGCCMHACSTLDCPEPICGSEFPGGIKSYLRYKKMLEYLHEGCDVDTVAERLNISVSWARKKFNIATRLGVK